MASDDKKYQVFVSSTFEDLREERSEVTQALLELDCIPSGMELFPAADEDQWSLIKGVIDDCDYYLLIIGGRYGSVGLDGLSYTEMEYRYAVERRKPVLAFIHGNPGSIPNGKSEQDPDNKKKLAAFRDLAQKKMVKYWSSAHELGGVVSRSMVSLKKSHPAVGWIRGDRLASVESATEMLRLRQRIDELEALLRSATSDAPPEAAGLAHGSEHYELLVTFETIPSIDATVGTIWKDEPIAITWDDLFSAAAPVLIGDASSSQVRTRLNQIATATVELEFTGSVGRPEFQDLWLKPGSVEMSDLDFETILVQFRALGYIAKSSQSSGAREAGDHWTLTPYGQVVLTRLLAIPSDAAKRAKWAANQEKISPQ